MLQTRCGNRFGFVPIELAVFSQRDDLGDSRFLKRRNVVLLKLACENGVAQRVNVLSGAKFGGFECLGCCAVGVRGCWCWNGGRCFSAETTGEHDAGKK